MSRPFHFKNFSVSQDRCAMKIGTDGVLLGAWANVLSKADNALDIGTGTGVIALMLAQRFLQLRVLGIDIDANAAEQAVENFQASPFSERLSARTVDIEHLEIGQKFDAIVSNPPFFTSGVLPENEQRKLARHTASFSFEMLFNKVAQLLTEKGVFSLIIPISLFDDIQNLGSLKGLFLKRYCIVHPNPVKPAKRILASFGFEKQESVIATELTIETDVRHKYTCEYKELLKDFYLAF